MLLSSKHLFCFLVLLVAACAVAGEIRFREAPLFYNSPSCPPPLLKSANSVCSSSALVHVAMTLDVAYLRGSMAAIHSILQHSSCPQSIYFHFLASSSIPDLNSTLCSTFPSLPFLIHHFDPSLVSSLISTSIRAALDRPLNYARSYLPRLLPPCISRAVYLDSVLILVDDIASLAATPHPKTLRPRRTRILQCQLHRLLHPDILVEPHALRGLRGPPRLLFQHGGHGNGSRPLARGGIHGADRGVDGAAEADADLRAWFSTAVSFGLCRADRGGGSSVEPARPWGITSGALQDLHPGPASLLHWSGKGKPWARLDAGRPCPLDALWALYDLLKPAFSIDDSSS
ncbi:hypothetical protein HPP92_017260 [Vanilla planifolia]|uniref:Hexosyltransferase n=1 Tax=Vanilla planifolia TaxID=51239 RepID=A0A835UN98_VANPL|nr:hypothetical protein HPP92_017260 [Vanilla planifolia]